MLKIIPYDQQYAVKFRELNLKWLDQFGLTESHDLMILDDPEGTIIDRGGYIFIAIDENEPVGTAALMKTEGEGFELAKMTVAEKWRGKGISKLLIEKCIEQAKSAGARHLSLFSNHQLVAAIQLYEKYGFRHVEVKDAPFETADICMILDLTEGPEFNLPDKIDH